MKVEYKNKSGKKYYKNCKNNFKRYWF